MGNLRTVLAASAVALLLAACTNADVEHSESASPSASVSVSASATASPSPSGELTTEELLALLPPGAELPDVQGAIVTAEFFVKLYGEMLRTGDTRIWDALSGPECEFCIDSAAVALKYVELGTKIEGGDTTVDSSRTRGRLSDDGYTYVGVVLEQDEVLATKQGSTTEVAATAGQYGLAMQMELVDGHWKVLHAQIVSPQEVS